MTLRSILYACALFLCLPFHIFGQKTSLSNAYLVKTYTFYKNTDARLHHENYFEAMGEKMHLSPQSKMVLTEETPGKNGYTHFKYQQYHAGLPIFGSRYMLHEKDGKVKTATGHYRPQVSMSATPSINVATAVALAQRDMQAKTYSDKETEPILCFIDPAFPKVSESLCLAYQVDAHSTEPFDKCRYFVDATSGKIITQLPLILREGVPSKAKTRYYGMQNITTDSVGPQEFVLRDPTRGEGIFIYNSNGTSFTSTSSTWDLTNDQKDEVALDAHYCTQEFYDMMLEDYNWQGQDGHGKALKAYVHGGDYVNAFWDGESSTYGDGDCNYGPLTTFEVIGHEFTHGVVQYTSGLVYEGESGAINESLADMFGKLLERKSDPTHFSWSLGHSFALSPESQFFRVMDDPNSVEMPALYRGQYWEDGNDVHTNSAIGNLWFSMLVDGKQGTNEAGVAFDVSALGPEKVGQIVFEVNKNYLTESSDYNAFYQYSVAVAEALYGAGSTEVQAVTEAWKAVGLPSELNTDFDLGLQGGGFSISNFCGLDQYLPVNIKVVNLSSVAYNPSMMGSVRLSNFTISDYIIPLTSPIGPGEVFEVQVDNWLQATEPGFTSISVSLEVDDANADNNESYFFYNVAEFAAGDLSLDEDLSTEGCFATVQYAGMYVENNGCEAIPAGTVLQFSATDEDDNPVWSSPYTLAEDLDGFGTLFIGFELPVVNSALYFVLDYPNDPDTENNESYDESGQYLPITGNYLNTFEIDGGQDEYVELQYYSFESIITYQNNQYFASTGVYQDPEEFQRCADITSVFDYEYASGINASLHTCLDFSTSAAPTLEFDLVQFRNASAAPGFQQSSMMQARWQGNASGNETIFGQVEGAVKHHNILLPPFFKGALDLKMYTEVGQWTLDPSYFDEDDFVLLDNLQLRAPTSGTDDLPTDFPVLISPNPAGASTTIQAAAGLQTIQLQNLSGQILHTWQVHASTYDLDLQGLASGFYLLNIELENGQRGVRKVVKME